MTKFVSKCAWEINDYAQIGLAPLRILASISTTFTWEYHPPRKKIGGLRSFLPNQVTAILCLPKHVEEAYQFHHCGNHFSEEVPKTSPKIWESCWTSEATSYFSKSSSTGYLNTGLNNRMIDALKWIATWNASTNCWSNYLGCTRSVMAILFFSTIRSLS